MDKLRLPDVTLVMVTTVCHELSAMAVKECTDRAEFGDVLVLSDKDLGIPGARRRHFEAGNIDAAVRAYWYAVPPLVETGHFLVIQWDSWIVNPKRWHRDFLAYDYVGAPWWYADDDRNVGNGGFSLRSTRLMSYLAECGPMPFAQPEDDVLCRKYRPRLEGKGFTWAPAELASRFSFERVLYCPMKEVLGFHGMFNWPFVLTEDQIEERVAKAPAHVIDHVHYVQMRETQKRIKGLVA
jgi:hypothetical protein